ncbi:ATP-binding protein [Altererythrobacter sp. Root672]|uniref:sensor histidine kinase n=1 Tax=Altererythrobacter sp. Root672 TaxID=1736584 RepID=UPI0006FD506E|nr:ATP-binding protein [Altererythrobacter sp. Root672]KRA80413.1 histidine kinase [Altererythrobacter sp. Root672]
MLLSVALALLVAQAISAVLQYRAAEQRREMIAANGLAFQLVTEPRFDFRPNSHGPDKAKRGRWQRLRVERTSQDPLKAGEVRDSEREALLRTILVDQGIDPAKLMVVTRRVANDDYVMAQSRGRERTERSERSDWANGRMLVAGLQRQGETEWTVARWAISEREPDQLGALIGQTLLLYVVLVGGLALLLRRITRPLAALTRRVEHFAATREIDGQIEPTGPDDTRRLIMALNLMESRIAALLNEKDVMLGAIGHDLKTPLAALRVRIESVEDDTERAKMAASIEDLSRSLDDILSLARVGRPSDPLERTDLSALLASVVEEYEDMGEPVELGATQRVAMALRATWLRRAMRNLIGNALRYGERARVSLVRQGNEAVITIEDDGPGIPEGDIARLMEPFARGESSRNRETGGAGLGLTLARAIAEQHGGTISLRNRNAAVGKPAGLIAELRLPLD